MSVHWGFIGRQYMTGGPLRIEDSDLLITRDLFVSQLMRI